MELSQEDMARLKKQLDDAKRERDAALRECAGLQQQCTAAIRQWDNALRERNDAREQLQRTQQQRDDAMKEINQAMAIRLKAGKDLNRLTEERNAAVQEYALIMSERDSVHKEMEKFQEELATKNSELSTSENKIKSLQDENEGLKREIASALQDRDRALKECNQLRECSPLQKQHEQDSQAYKDQIEALHKEVTKLKNELTEAQQVISIRYIYIYNCNIYASVSLANLRTLVKQKWFPRLLLHISVDWVAQFHRQPNSIFERFIYKYHCKAHRPN